MMESVLYFNGWPLQEGKLETFPIPFNIFYYFHHDLYSNQL